jgi:hypothetical protein
MVQRYLLEVTSQISTKFQQLKKNLSTEALKGFRGETTNTPLKSRHLPDESNQITSPSNSLQVSLCALNI